jgi:hypothetical protein
VTTKAQTRQDIADNLFPNDRFRRGTTDAANNTATLLYDAGLQSNMVRPSRMIDAYVLLTAGARAGEYAQVEQFDHVNGILTLGGGIGGAPGHSNTYELFYGINPEQVEDAMNEMRRRTRHPQLWIPSLVTDSYLEDDTVTSFWTVEGAPAFFQYDTSAEDVYHGERSIYISGVDGTGFYSDGFNVLQDEKLLVSTIARVVSGSLAVSLRLPGGATTFDTVTLDEIAFSEARFVWTLSLSSPSACALYFIGVGVYGAYVSAPVVVQSGFRREYSAPSWLTSESQVEEMVYVASGRAASAQADTYYPLTGSSRARTNPQFIRSDRDVHPLRLQMTNPADRLVAVAAKRPMAEFADAAVGATWVTEDAVDSPVDQDYAAAKVTSILLRKRGARGWRSWEREADKHARRMRYGGRGE